MSYYECLMWLCNYLQKQVVPAINENAEAVNELINWFNNLDVQDEIDDKLDRMAESGELEEIIASYLNTNAVLGFNTKADLVGAENLVDGSFARTFGKNSLNDGLSSLYKIRTLVNTDVVDGENIVALTNFETLIAEKIVNTYEDDITVFVGDSFGAGAEHSWVKTYCELNGLTLNTNAFNFCNGASGFTIENNSYLYNLQRWESAIPNKLLVKKIIVAGGWNDRANAADIESAISSFMTYVKANYPNAKVYCGMLANYGNIDDTAGSLYWRSILTGTILDKYQKIINYGGYYLYGVEQVLHNYSLISNDYVHPTNDGYVALGRAISQAVNEGSFSVNGNLIFYTRLSSDTLTLNTTDVKDTTNLILNNVIKYGNIFTMGYGAIDINDKDSLYNVLNVTIGTFTNASFNYFRHVNAFSGISGLGRVKYGSNTYVIAPYKLSFNRNGTVKLTVTLEEDITGAKEFVPITYETVNILNN